MLVVFPSNVNQFLTPINLAHISFCYYLKLIISTSWYLVRTVFGYLVSRVNIAKGAKGVSNHLCFLTRRTSNDHATIILSPSGWFATCQLLSQVLLVNCESQDFLWNAHLPWKVCSCESPINGTIVYFKTFSRINIHLYKQLFLKFCF